MKFDSPLRYPGGKAALAPFLAKTIALNGLAGCAYYEPFAGGAGAALCLLRQGVVSRIHINDLDPRIATFWRVAIGESERFADAIMSAELTVTEWKRQREVYRQCDAHKPFELGFATFYLNRCNRSGMLFGAAPIGGYEQAGEWKIDARFYRESLAKRVKGIGRLSDQIHLSNLDARQFLIDELPSGRGRSGVFAYLDPPYWDKGSRLYLNSYSPKDHTALARYMQRQNTLKWIMSYDDAPAIRGLYNQARVHPLHLRYNLNESMDAKELLISPHGLKLPSQDGRSRARAWITT